MADPDLDVVANQILAAHRKAKPKPVAEPDVDAIANQLLAAHKLRGPETGAKKPTGKVARSLSWRAGVDASLSDTARARLDELDEVLRGHGVKGTITSGRRRGGPPSHHHAGNAVDFVSTGGQAQMVKLARDLKNRGFRAQFEFKGQVNPNKSVATGDHIHVTLLGSGAPFASAKASFAPGHRATSAPAKLRGVDTDAREPSVDAVANQILAQQASRPGQQGQKPTGGKAVVADLMGSLLRGEHLPAKPKPTAKKPAVTQPTQAGMIPLLQQALDPLGAMRGLTNMQSWMGTQMGRPVAGMTAAFNELERQAQIRRSQPGYQPILGFIDPTLNISGDISAALAAGKQAFQSGQQPEVSFLRQWAGMEPGKGNAALYGAVTAAEQMLPFAYDPLNIAFPTALAGAGRLAPKAQKIAGRVPLVGPQVRAAQQGQEIIENVIQPLQRHKEDLQAVLREGNRSLQRLRKGNTVLDKEVRATGTHPLYDLAAQAAKTDPAQRGAILAAGKAKGIPPGEVKRISEALTRNADETLTMMRASGKDPLKDMTREEWLDNFFAIDADTGQPAGLAMARQARLRMTLKAVVPLASDKPGPGLVQVPTKMRELEDGRKIPVYGQAAGKYLPKQSVVKLMELVEKGEKPIGWHKVVRAGKNAYLYQPFTPFKSFWQNMGGLKVMLHKEGLSQVDSVPHVPSSFREFFDFSTKGVTSQAIKEFSDIDPSMLEQLKDVTIADGTAGRFVRFGGKTIPLSTVPEAATSLFAPMTGSLSPLSSEHVFLKANGATDVIGKLIGFKTLRAKGYTPEQAVKMVNRHVISFGNLPPDVGKWVVKADRNGLWTFANVPVQLAITAARTAVTRPDLLARPGQLQERMLKAFGAEERYAEKVSEEKKSPYILPNPFTVGPEFVDWSALAPLSDPMAKARGLVRMAEAPPTAMEALEAFAKGSIAGPWVAPFTQPGLIPKGATPTEIRDALIQHFKDTYNPLGRAAGEFASIGEGRQIARDPYAPEESLAEYTARKFGVRPVKTGTRAEQKKAGRADVTARRRVTGAVWRQEAIAARLQPINETPEEAQRAAQARAENKWISYVAKKFTPEQARNELRQVIKGVKYDLLSRQNLVRDGQATDEAVRLIRDRAQYLEALKERMRQPR